MPEAAGECVVHVMGHGSPVELGTRLTLPEETEGVSGQVFTVVGAVQDPQHFSTDSESSTVGDGQLDCILFVPEGTLTADYYTACYIKAENAGLYDNYSDEYQAAVDAVAEKLKAIQSVQCTARREELMDTANDKLTEARAEYDNQKQKPSASLPKPRKSWQMRSSSWMPPRRSWKPGKRSLPPRRLHCRTPCRAVPTSW